MMRVVLMAEYTPAAHYGPGDLLAPSWGNTDLVVLRLVTGRGWRGGERPLSLIGVHILVFIVKLFFV